MVEEVKIKVTGDSTDAQKALDAVKKDAAQLNGQLKTLAAGSAIAFAGLTAAIGISVNAFARQEQALLRQEAVLKSTGFAAGITADELQKMASGLQSITTFGDEAVIEGQNLLLTFKNIGKDTFPRATKALLDMSTAMGTGIKESAIQLGKALNDPIAGISALSRVGITFTDEQKKLIKTLTETGKAAEAQKIILKELESQFGGAAEAAAKGTGVFKQLNNEFGDLLEVIGKGVLPVLIPLAQALKAVITAAKNSEFIQRFGGRLLLLGAAVTGITAAVAAAILGFGALKVSLVALNITLTATRIKAALALGVLTLGLGAIIAFLPEIIEFAKKMLSTFTKTFTAIAKLAVKAFEIVKKAATLDFSGAKKAFAEFKSLAIDTAQQAAAEFKKADFGIELTADNSKAIAAGEEATGALQTQLEAQRELKDAELELDKLRQDNATGSAIQSKQQEIALLRAITEAKTEEDIERFDADIERLREERAVKREVMAEEAAIDREQEVAFREEFEALDDEDKARISAKEREQFKKSVLTRKKAESQVAKERLKIRIEQRNSFLIDEAKFGTTVASLRSLFRKGELQNAQKAANQLISLQNAKNSTIKSVGKAAAIANIIFTTPQAAMDAYSALAGIPIVGPALGAAAAAAVIGYGAEQLSTARSAQTGGVVSSISEIPGVGTGDKIPIIAEPGEILIPRPLAPSFQEQFAIDKDREEGGGEVSTNVNIVIDTLIGTDEFVQDNVIPAIKDALEFDNADIGV